MHKACQDLFISIRQVPKTYVSFLKKTSNMYFESLIPSDKIVKILRFIVHLNQHSVYK